MSLRTPIETETKFLNVRAEGLEDHLRALGAEEVYRGHVHAEYFDDREGSFAARNISLRLRHKIETNVVNYTVKRRLSKEHVRICDEAEIMIGEGAEGLREMQRALELQGLEVRQKLFKHRVTLTLNDVRYEIDRLMRYWSNADGRPERTLKIPPLLEIEGPDLETIAEHAERLQLSMEDAIPRSTRWVVAHHDEHGRFLPKSPRSDTNGRKMKRK